MIEGFFKLNMQKIKLVDGFALNTIALEKEMQKHTGINLSESNFDNINEELLRKYVPFFEDDDSEKIRKLTEKYPSINSPCSMFVNSIEELTVHIEKAYQISYFHYVLGKKYNLRGSFPDFCCTKSSRNLLLSLFEAGYPNAALVDAVGRDHRYDILPFIMTKNAKDVISGTLIIDPTHDQMPFCSEIRNEIIIRLGSKWEYKDSKGGKNLYPRIVCSLDSIRQSLGKGMDNAYYSEEYFQKAFANPIKLNI